MVRWGVTRADCDERRTVRGETCDAVEERGLEGARQGHRLWEGGDRRAGIDVPAPGAEQDVCPLTRGATTGRRPAAAGQAQGRA
jgi:hypothetical protein